MANSVDPDQTATIGAVCSGSTLFASILNSSVMLGNYLQQTTSAVDIFRCILFLGALRVKKYSFVEECVSDIQLEIELYSGMAHFSSLSRGIVLCLSARLLSICLN